VFALPPGLNSPQAHTVGPLHPLSPGTAALVQQQP